MYISNFYPLLHFIIQIVIILLLIFTLEICIEKPENISTWFFVYKVCMFISILLNYDSPEIFLYLNDDNNPASDVCPCCNKESGCDCNCEIYAYIDPEADPELVEGPCCACGETGPEVGCELCSCVYHEECKPENSTTYYFTSDEEEQEQEEN